ncbi:MAG: isochorismatase family protein [Gammaproteobacteria bacterium]
MMGKVTLDPRYQVASFDVDAQNCFTPLCPDELPVREGNKIVDELNAQAQFACVRIGSKDAHPPNAIWVAQEGDHMLEPIEGENVDVRWPSHAVPGTFGFELIKGLPKVSEYDFFVWKGVEPDMHPYGSCYHDFKECMSTGVIEFLQARKIKTVLVGGLATEYCVAKTVQQLLSASFKVVINLEACRPLNPQEGELVLRSLMNIGALVVQNASYLVQPAG